MRRSARDVAEATLSRTLGELSEFLELSRIKYFCFLLDSVVFGEPFLQLLAGG